MDPQPPNFAGLRVAALESRRYEDMQRLIERFGGQAFVSPSMREVPIEHNREAIEFIYRVVTGEIGVVIFLTGVGFRHLLNLVEKQMPSQRFLDALSDITTIVRGPKPLAAMREVGLKPSHVVQEPNTWRELLALIDQKVPITNQWVGLQEYGIVNRSLVAGLEARGAHVVQVRVYQWELPEDITPLENNLQAILDGQRDLLLFTSAHQAVNLFRLAESRHSVEALRQSLSKMLVGSIGPTTTEMLNHLEIAVDIEPEHPKMGHLVQTAAEKCHRKLKAHRLRVELNELRLASQGSHAEGHPSEQGPFLLACRGKPAKVTPIWLMRQAGRYMAEYREVRSKMGFLELCKNPSLCAEVMVTAVQKLGVDAAIIFSDLLPILEPMGMKLEFSPGDGPVIHNPLRSANEIAQVRELETMDDLGFVMETVALTRKSLPDEIPVIGFSGSPFTLASYMIEGGSSRHYALTKSLMYQEPAAWRELMDRLARSIARYLNAQIMAGAQCVQLFDSWVGCLSVVDYARYILPSMQTILESIIPGIPVINFGTGNPMLLPFFRGDRRTVVGVDWRTPLDQAWGMVGTDCPVQGNLDPVVLLSDIATIRRESKRILDEAAGRAGHIFNLGHGILPQTPPENVMALVDIVHELSAR